jgi:hypothetical protein
VDFPVLQYANEKKSNIRLPKCPFSVTPAKLLNAGFAASLWCDCTGPEKHGGDCKLFNPWKEPAHMYA